MLEALGFFALMEAAGLAAAPLAALVLGRLPGAGLGFAKVLGVLLIGWLVWMAGSLGLAAYAQGRGAMSSPNGSSSGASSQTCIPPPVTEAPPAPMRK